MNVDILDVGSGNVRSVQNWIEKSNVPTRVISQPGDMRSELLILPGVGSAGFYMHRIKSKNFDEAINEHVRAGKRLLGICLGFQIMMKSSEEDGGTEGLGLLDGYVERLKIGRSHNGWESLHLRTTAMDSQSFNGHHKLTKKRTFKGRVFYNHEYGVVNKEKRCFSRPVSNKYPQYTGLLIKENIIGFQFHPEKSQLSGSELINLVL